MRLGGADVRLEPFFRPASRQVVEARGALAGVVYQCTCCDMRAAGAGSRFGWAGRSLSARRGHAGFRQPSSTFIAAHFQYRCRCRLGLEHVRARAIGERLVREELRQADDPPPEPSCSGRTTRRAHRPDPGFASCRARVSSFPSSWPAHLSFDSFAPPAPGISYRYLRVTVRVPWLSKPSCLQRAMSSAATAPEKARSTTGSPRAVRRG